MKNNKGQVWIETVLYTLIGISLIGLVLAFAMPKINESKDRAIIEQSINSLQQIDEKIDAILQAPGNTRILEFSLKRGSLYIDGERDIIYLGIEDLVKPFSEPGTSIPYGGVVVYSEQGQRKSSVTLTLNYTGKMNISFSEKDELKKLDSASTPYKFSLRSLPLSNGIGQISIEEISGR